MSENKLQISSAPEIVNERDTEFEIDLLELLYRLIEKAQYIIACALIGAIVMGVYSFIFATPMYQATSKLYVMNSSDSAINLSDLQIGSYLTNDYQEVFNTWEVRQMVIQNLDLDYSYTELGNMMSISNPNDTRMLYITVTSADPAEAALIANELADVARMYVSETMATDAPSVFSEALQPKSPVSPNKTRNVILGFLLGGILMAGIVTVQFIMDDKIKSADDIRRYTGLPTLAIVPTNDADKAAASKSVSHAQRGERRGK